MRVQKESGLGGGEFLVWGVQGRERREGGGDRRKKGSRGGGTERGKNRIQSQGEGRSCKFSIRATGKEEAAQERLKASGP